MRTDGQTQKTRSRRTCIKEWISLEKRRIHPSCLLLCSGLLLVGGLVAYGFWRQMQIAITSGRLSLSALAISKTFPLGQWKTEYDPLQAIFDEFPRLKRHDKRLVDGWGNDISITITEHAELFVVDVISAGRDQQFDTSDDLWRKVEFSKKDEAERETLRNCQCKISGIIDSNCRNELFVARDVE